MRRQGSRCCVNVDPTKFLNWALVFRTPTPSAKLRTNCFRDLISASAHAMRMTRTHIGHGADEQNKHTCESYTTTALYFSAIVPAKPHPPPVLGPMRCVTVCSILTSPCQTGSICYGTIELSCIEAATEAEKADINDTCDAVGATTSLCAANNDFRSAYRLRELLHTRARFFR